MQPWPGEGPPSPGRRGTGRVRLYPVLVSFGVVFLGELPDKTMFASLILATRGRPVRVWIGAAVAFAVHVAIAVTVGIALFALVPHLVVAAMFLAGAAYAWLERPEGDEPARPHRAGGRSAVLTAFVVIFLAEWGDLTQILTANLAARNHAPLEVAVGATAALWAVAALAVSAGQTLQRHLNVRLIHRVTAIVLLCLAGSPIWPAFAFTPGTTGPRRPALTVTAAGGMPSRRGPGRTRDA